MMKPRQLVLTALLASLALAFNIAGLRAPLIAKLRALMHRGGGEAEAIGKG